MKIKITALLLLISIVSFSQEKDKYGLDYKKIEEEEQVFLPTWNNIFNSISMPTEIFDKLMLEYDYKMVDNQYVKKINNTLLSIKRINKGLEFYWISISLKTSDIEDKFTEFYEKTEEDVKIYNVKKGNQNIRLEIKNKGNLGGYLLFQFNNIK